MRSIGCVYRPLQKYKAISYETITGQKPIVLLIPGVMGTHLRIGDDIVWIDLEKSERPDGHRLAIL
ncbi:MAG: hypothetical protein IPI77_24085 [Saprospiraceae bacterium]|nr:hypothetical protein [Saprospiraceae bacterium]